MFKKILFLLLASLLFNAKPIFSDFVYKDGWVHRSDDVATGSAQEHYFIACEAYKENDWHEAAKHFRIVGLNFPESSFGSDAFFFEGTSLFELDEFDRANIAFSNYLECKKDPRYFEEAIHYKFTIADRFRCGAKRRPYATKHFPKWLSADELALEIYDEVIAAAPTHQLAAEALYRKGCLLWRMKEFKESVDSYQLFIKRFPKHEKCPYAYLNINRVYLEQSRVELQNPDLIALAEVNTGKFRSAFPRDDMLKESEEDIQRIKEVYAGGLQETAAFYERTIQPGAAVIYYQNAIMKFPETTVAEKCRKRLSSLCPQALNEIEEKLEALNDAYDQGIDEASKEFDISDFLP